MTLANSSNPQNPAQRKRSNLQRDLDRSKAIRMNLRGIPNYKIAAELNVTPAQISYDLKMVQKQWEQQTNLRLDLRKANELAKLNDLEATYWEAYELEPFISLLDGVLKCIDRRCKLLGLDAPVKIDQRNLNFTISFDTPGSANEDDGGSDDSDMGVIESPQWHLDHDTDQNQNGHQESGAL